MKYGVVGASGKMGKEVVSTFTEQNHELVFTFDIHGDWKQRSPEIVIDGHIRKGDSYEKDCY